MINGLFELGGSGAVGLSVRQILRDKQWAGLSPWNLCFFQLWGLWNLYFYPSLDQPFSFAGGLALATMNAVYLYLIWKYRGPQRQPA